MKRLYFKITLDSREASKFIALAEDLGCTLVDLRVNNYLTRKHRKPQIDLDWEVPQETTLFELGVRWLAIFKCNSPVPSMLPGSLDHYQHFLSLNYEKIEYLVQTAEIKETTITALSGITY